VDEPNLSRFAIVLCGAEEAGNVGSVCRAMKTMGFDRLILAGCPAYDDQRVATLAVHAYDVYERAERYPSLETALSRVSFAAGFTRRRGERRKAFSLSVEDFAEQATTRDGTQALVFGNERTGLTREELDLCSIAVHIPVSSAFPSLNLAQAVQIACYELRKHAIEGRDGSAEPAARIETSETVSRIVEHLRTIGFFKITSDVELSVFLRDIAERAALTPGELRRFESVFRKAAGMIRSTEQEKSD
jgi:TrmH family RNA methyltransferase